MEKQKENNAMNYSGNTTAKNVRDSEIYVQQQSDRPFYDKWMDDTTPITPEQMAYIEQLCGGFSNN